MVTLERLERTIRCGQLRLLRPPGAVPLIPADLQFQKPPSPVDSSVDTFLMHLAKWGVRPRRR